MIRKKDQHKNIVILLNCNDIYLRCTFMKLIIILINLDEDAEREKKKRETNISKWHGLTLTLDWK